MRAKYLGIYEYRLNDNLSFDTESLDVLVNINNECDWYPMEFVNTDKTSIFNGVMTETNTSAIVCKLNNCNDEFKLWRLF